ncbi:MAG: hypothetical protein ACT4QA_16610 [Panacagrimonas sp.]
MTVAKPDSCTLCDKADKLPGVVRKSTAVNAIASTSSRGGSTSKAARATPDSDTQSR